MSDLDLKEIIRILHVRLLGLENGNFTLISDESRTEQNHLIHRILNSVKEGE